MKRVKVNYDHPDSLETDLLDIKVYVEADADERILRRISRDVEERGRDLNGIIEQYLTTVKPMHYLYVEPTRAKADIVINSGKNNVAFDLFVSKIRQLLEQLSDQDKKVQLKKDEDNFYNDCDNN